MSNFKLVTKMKPQGDQEKAITALTKAFLSGRRFKTLLGVTGSGKTFTMANVICKVNKPTIVISHNKTLAAQLYCEFRELFPENAVEYFVSYYDYYQPEAYVPQTDTYIEKDASINEEIDKLRLSATSSIMARRDVIIVASVSCIYGLGSPDDYAKLLCFIEKGQATDRDTIAKRLIDIHYGRNDIDFTRGVFRMRGDIIDIFPAYEERAVRIELDGEAVSRISEIDPLTGKTITELEKAAIYPAKHFVTTREKIETALVFIEKELNIRLDKLRGDGKLLEAQRLESRTRYDMEMLNELGYCSGIENYSRQIAGRPAGSRPYCLLDYFPDDFLTIIDESHVTIPQIRGMFAGDRARKEILVEYGFRLPSALDNRPLMFDEFDAVTRQMLFASATPARYELEKDTEPVEQIIRPTGLVDPEIIIKPSDGEIDDLIGEIRKRVAKRERVLVTTLTKHMAEDLSGYMQDVGIRVRYLHSEIGAIDRARILRDLRLGEFDCLVGINLLREGLDLPEVSLVAILDADKEGFLRSQTSLIQVAGRAARNLNSRVIMYADNVTDSMKRMLEECGRRREIQLGFNKKNGITPHTVRKAIKEGIEAYAKAKKMIADISGQTEDEHEVQLVMADMEREMELAARNLEFEKAAAIRDQLAQLKKECLEPDAGGGRPGGKQGRHNRTAGRR